MLMQQTITESAQSLIDETLISQADAKKNTKGRVTFVNSPLKMFSILFNHAFPLDLSITKYCFQGCPFCFATANKRFVGDVIGKNEDPTDLFFRKLQKANGQGYDSSNLMEWCLANKYPIIFSNNVDPFMPASEAQFKLGEKILKACIEHKQPLFIQTKEVYYGEEVKRLLIEGKDLFQMYVSISTLEYETAKKYETVAITPDERFRRIKELTDAGMHVVVALNPYVPDWTPDLRAYFKRVKESGATGVFAYPLHLTASQKKVMPKRFAEFSVKSNRYEDFHQDTEIMEKFAEEFDLQLYYPRRFKEVEKKYYKGVTAWSEDKNWPIDAERFVQSVHKIWLEEKKPLLLQWKDCDFFYEQYKEWNHIFRVSEFDSFIATTSEGHKQVRTLLGKMNKTKNIVRMLWNNPEEFDMFLCFYLNVFQLADSEGTTDKDLDLIYDEGGDLCWVYDPTWKKDPYYWDQSDPANKDVELLEL